MGLDACVYCDCLEKGKTLVKLPPDALVGVEDNGLAIVEINGETHDYSPSQHDFECVHTAQKLCNHRLGNISLIGLLRAELNRDSSAFPILVQKVVYSGSHAGDFIPLDQIFSLQQELERVKSFKCVGNLPAGWIPRFLWAKFRIGRYHYTTASEADKFMQYFRVQMLELCGVAILAKKPIAF